MYHGSSSAACSGGNRKLDVALGAGGLKVCGRALGTLGDEEAMAVSESSAGAKLLVYLPRESLGGSEESLGIDRAAQGNRRQSRDLRESKNPSLVVGSNL